MAIGTKRFTRADLERLPDDGKRYEIIDGELVVSPSSTLRHALVVAAIYDALAAWARAHGGVVLASPYDLFIADDQNLVPDLLLMLPEHLHRFEERYLREPPDLVVEVSASRDSSGRDLGPKHRIYAAFAVPEYWVANLREDVLLAFRLDRQRGQYRAPEQLGFGDVLRTPLLPGFEAKVNDLLVPSPVAQRGAREDARA